MLIMMNGVNKMNMKRDNVIIIRIILQAEKFLKCDWLRPVVFHPNLKYLHVKLQFPS